MVRQIGQRAEACGPALLGTRHAGSLRRRYEGMVLMDVMKSADEDTYVLSGACARKSQKKLFKRVLRESGFDEND
jgi:hypothetical protein